MNKKRSFPVTHQNLAIFAKALSHPARLAILNELASRNTCVCGDIVNALPLAQATVSQHLQELKSAGLIKGTLDGPKSCYCIDVVHFEKIRTEFADFLKELSKLNTDNLCC